MYSSRLVSLLYIAIAVLLTTVTLVSAAPVDPGRTPGEVIADNREMACRMWDCYIRNGTNATDAVSAANAAATAAASTPIPIADSSNGAIGSQPAVILPAVIAGASLLLLM
ncbi:hypothetical protein JB92DRAFT_3132099 [Gautieria morchelliformis]|nr:hypothetical protein JB92DRAFT_3132099 [Gautieria morchelliformis]